MRPVIFPHAEGGGGREGGREGGRVVECNRTPLGSNQGAHGVVISHPLRMRKALGSIPSVSMSNPPNHVIMQQNPGT